MCIIKHFVKLAKIKKKGNVNSLSNLSLPLNQPHSLHLQRFQLEEFEVRCKTLD